MHDVNRDGGKAQWSATQTAAQPAPGGLRSTLPSQSSPRGSQTHPQSPAQPQAFGLESQPASHASHPGAPAYGQPQAHEQPAAYGQPGARSWDQGRQVGQDAGADTGRRSQGVKNIVGGIALIGIGFLFGGSVFLGNPGVLDWIFDGLGTFWVCKGLYEVFTA